MRVGTPTLRGIRVGLHVFRWGAHLKLRRGDRFRHVVAKVRRVNRFGRVSGREVWVGWWISDKGERKPYSGVSLGFRVEHFGRVAISEGMDHPFYPTKPRKLRSSS